MNIAPDKRPYFPARNGLKVCCRCRQEKPVSEFYPKKGGSGVSPYCSPCKREMKNSDKNRFSWTILPEDVARFWSHTEPGENGCIVWKDYKNSYGYGQFYLRGRQLGAHRIAWKMAGHELPKWPKVIDHTCRNRACVEVAHMRIVTQRINTLENSVCPHAKNAAKTECDKGHPFSDENTAIVVRKNAKGRYYSGRVCLTCYPVSWMYAIVERTPPPGAKMKWQGPQSLPKSSL
jgi:hypothetical protein